MPDDHALTRSELNQKYRDGEIEKNEYNRRKLQIMARARHKKDTAPPSDAKDALYGSLWRFGNSGGVALFVYLITVVIMFAVVLASHANVLPQSESSGGTGDANVDILLMYILPSLPSFLLGVMGTVSRPGRAWAVITMVLSVVASPAFVMMGVVGNPTWTLIAPML